VQAASKRLSLVNRSPLKYSHCFAFHSSVFNCHPEKGAFIDVVVCCELFLGNQDHIFASTIILRFFSSPSCFSGAMVPILDDSVGKTLALPSRWQTLVLRHRFLCPNFGATVVLVALSFGVYRVRDPPYRFPATGFIALQNSLMDGEMKASMHVRLERSL
jgi:hypothetical protein